MSVLRSPIKDKESAIENTIEYPTGRLSAVTRKKNDIKSLLLSTPPPSNDDVKQAFDEYNVKIDNFEFECSAIFDNKQIEKEPLITFTAWYNKHMEEMIQFRKAIQS